MSSTLSWRPNAPATDRTLGSAMKFALRERSENNFVREVLGEDDLPWLHGMVAGAGKDSELGKDAAALIAAINQHGEICVEEDYGGV